MDLERGRFDYVVRRVLTLAFVLAFASRTAQAADTVHFAVGPLQPTPGETKKAFDPFFKHLAEQLGVAYTLEATTDWAGIAVVLASGQVDVAWMGPWGMSLRTRLSALDNVLVGRLGEVPAWRVMLRRFPHRDRQLALAALDRVGMLPYALQRADSLSGGQQQRVAIARALAQQSRFVLADEPVASLDPESAKSVPSILRDIAKERMIAVLISLHQVEFAIQFADRVIGLRAGRMIADRAAAAFAEADHRMIFAT